MTKRPYEITVRVDTTTRVEATFTVHAEDAEEAKDTAVDMVCGEANTDAEGKVIVWTDPTNIEAHVRARKPKQKVR
jgi:hypothetical protein